MQKTAVITGVSSGIGRACAERLAAAGWHVFGSVRRPADAEPLAAALGEHFTALVFDVTDPAAVGAAAERVGEALGSQRLGGLINNAGVAVAGRAPTCRSPNGVGNSRSTCWDRCKSPRRFCRCSAPTRRATGRADASS